MIWLVWALCIAVMFLTGWCYLLHCEIKGVHEILDQIMDVIGDIVKVVTNKSTSSRE